MTRAEDALAMTECSGEPLEFHALGRRAVAGKGDPSGADRRLPTDRSKPLASSSTLNRLELTTADANARGRYKKIVADTAGMDRLLVDCFREAYGQPPEEIWTDVDATDDPLDGRQEGRLFHGYYGCSLPMLSADRSDHSFPVSAIAP